MAERRKLIGYVRQSAMRQVRTINTALLCVVAWLLFLMATSTNYSPVAPVDAYIKPIALNLVSTDWYQAKETGHWRAHIISPEKEIPCVFDRTQPVLGFVQLLDNSPSFEIPVTFIEDVVPHKNHLTDYQSFGIWEFQSANIDPKSTIFVKIQNLCYGYANADSAISNFKLVNLE